MGWTEIQVQTSEFLPLSPSIHKLKRGHEREGNQREIEQRIGERFHREWKKKY